MKSVKIPIKENDLTFLQAYLYKTFSLENRCNDNFDYTEWYLKERYSQEEINAIVNFFKGKGINCDCDIINKLELGEI